MYSPKLCFTASGLHLGAELAVMVAPYRATVVDNLPPPIHLSSTNLFLSIKQHRRWS